MNCVNCGGALPPKSAICPYCSTLNDIDLQGLFDFARRRPDASRKCPRCDKPMEVLDLELGGPFYINRCTQCLGLFFAPGELSTVVRAKVEAADRADLGRLERLLSEETPADFADVHYLKCPVCRALMNSRSYGALAGVIIDECREHGVWLDGGELRRILNWTRAGGPEHQAERQVEADRERARQRRLAIPTGMLSDADDSSAEVLDIPGLFGRLIRTLFG